MTGNSFRRALTAGALAVAMVVPGTVTASASTITQQVRGDGGSSFGFAWMYARRDARDHALAAGFSDPANQCTEIFAFGNNYSAMVIWECTM